MKKISKLEFKFRKEVQKLATGISVENPLTEQRVVSFIKSPFPSDGFMTSTLEKFGMVMVDLQDRDYAHVPLDDGFVGLAFVGDNLAITVKAKLTRIRMEKDPITEWVKIDNDTKKLKPVLDDQKQPTFKERQEKNTTDETITLYVPVSVYVEILDEIGLSSIIDEPPKDYIPKELGSAALTEMAMVMKTMFGFDMSYSNIEQFDRHHPRMKHISPHPGGPYWDHHFSSFHDRPVRVFLQPEKGTKRVEVVVEPYSKAEIRENRDQIASRTEWAKLQCFRTDAVRRFIERILPQTKGAF